jgi:glycerophosphoryl diester phosphodiesterase
VFSLALALLATMLAAVASYVGIPSEVSSVRTLLLTMGFMSVFGAVESFVISFISTSMLSLLILKLFNDFGLSREADPGVYEDVSWAPRLKLNRKSVISALVAGLLLATVVVYSLLGQLRFESETEVMAHRGASAVAPENTMAAIQGAIDSGAGWVEIDVQETADGEIVVIHDSDLKKVGGIPMVVA